MAWLAVDYDRGEYIYDYKPVRRGYLTWGQESIDGEELGDCVELPKGTIKKIIGRELTWEDEPVELEEKL